MNLHQIHSPLVIPLNLMNTINKLYRANLKKARTQEKGKQNIKLKILKKNKREIFCFQD